MALWLLWILGSSPAAPEPAPPPAESAPAGIAPGRLQAPPQRLVGGHRLIQQADGSWTNLDRRAGLVATIEVDGRLRFERIDYAQKPAHPWYASARDPVSGQPTGAASSVSGGSAGGDALAALIAAGVFKGIELGSERRHGKPALTQPLDVRHRFALDTADFRDELATAWYDARLQEALDRLDVQLRGLWADAISSRARRAAVFELWNRFPDALPPAPLHPPPNVRSELERHRHEVAGLGREAILAFARAYLPRGTKDGFSRAELRRLDAQRLGTEPFDPYAESSTRAR